VENPYKRSKIGWIYAVITIFYIPANISSLDLVIAKYPTYFQ